MQLHFSAGLHLKGRSPNGLRHGSFQAFPFCNGRRLVLHFLDGCREAKTSVRRSPGEKQDPSQDKLHVPQRWCLLFAEAGSETGHSVFQEGRGRHGQREPLRGEAECSLSRAAVGPPQPAHLLDEEIRGQHGRPQHPLRRQKNVERMCRRPIYSKKPVPTQNNPRS